MSHSFAPIFAYLKHTHEFCVVRAYIGGKLEVFTECNRLLLNPDQLIFA